MAADVELREILDDAKACVETRSFPAALEILAEERDALCRSEPALRQAVDLLDACYFHYWQQKSHAEATAALELIFDMARGRLFADDGIDAPVLERYKRALAATGSSPVPFSRYFRHQNLIRLFSLTDGVEGDAVECGCARGLSSLELCLAIGEATPGWRGDGFHVFDSFQGLSEPQAQDLDTSGMEASEARRVLSMMHRGNMASPLEQVRAALHDFPGVAFHPGWIPESFAGLPERGYRFVHVDVDLYQPTLDAFDYFYPRLAEGGLIVTDDYNWPGGRRAVDEFCSRNGLKPGLTETSQAYLRRGGPAARRAP